MTVCEFVKSLAGNDAMLVVFKDDARREIARGHLRGIALAAAAPSLCRDYTLVMLLGREVLDVSYQLMFPYEVLSINVGRW